MWRGFRVAKKIVDTGAYERFEPGGVSKIPEFDPRGGDHYWIMTTAYNVKPEYWMPDHPAEPVLDHENLVLLVGPLCYYCEELYTPYLTKRRCKGMAQ